jgi:hypothetical protein
MIFKSVAAALSALAIGASSTLAATVVPTNGQVRVNQGSGFKDIKVPTAVQAGDIVAVAFGGNANISYSAKCLVPVNPGQIVTISKQDPCVVTGAMEQTQATLPPPPLPFVPLVGGLTPGGIAGTLIVGGVVAGTFAVGYGSKSSSP